MTFDLFKQGEDDDVTWVETVIGLNNLKKRLLNLSIVKPGIYLIYDPTEARFLGSFESAPVGAGSPDSSSEWSNSESTRPC